MRPNRSQSVGLVVMFLLTVVIAFAMLWTPAHGYWGYGGCCGCGQTWCAWSETWHAYSALDTPLRPYYIPRNPGCCNRQSYGNNTACGYAAQMPEGATGMAGCDRYPPEAAIGLEPVRFERLGQIPNDMDLGGLPAPVERSP
jgi:hypothetical protein